MDFCSTIDLFSRRSLLFRTVTWYEFWPNYRLPSPGLHGFRQLLHINAGIEIGINQCLMFFVVHRSQRISWPYGDGLTDCAPWRYLYCIRRCIRRGLRLMRAWNMTMRVTQEEVSVASYGDNISCRGTATHVRAVDMVNHNAEDLLLRD